MKKKIKKQIIASKEQEWVRIGTIDVTSGTQTWALDIPGSGCLVRVTQVRGRELDTAMVFAPNVNVIKEGEGAAPYRLVCLRPYETQITFTSAAKAAKRIKWSDTSKLDKKLAQLEKGKDTGVAVTVGDEIHP